MSDLIDLVKKYTIKYEHSIKSICAPMQIHLRIPLFGYFKIEADGSFGNFTNDPKELDFYYSEKFYLENPFFIHPSLLRSGSTYTPVVFNPEDTEKLFKEFQLNYVFLILEHREDAIEGFTFAEKRLDATNCSKLCSKLDMMYQFIHYFKHEANGLIQKMMREGFNLKKEKAEAFFKLDLSMPLSNKDPNALKFLKSISPLSKRERQCLNLFKQGHSAQTTAAHLGLSQRTIEHYFENIKNKLGCASKWELLKW